jgi:2-aminoethylphosphonate-pyruvate transaminase
MYERLRGKINRLFRADDSYFSVVVSGSGTASNETVLSSIVGEGESVMLIRNGVFGEKLLEIINNYGISLVDVPFEWAQTPDLGVIEKAIADHPDISVVAMVYHETSTGMINPVAEVGSLCEKYGKVYFVDCVSALGGEAVDLAAQKITIATSVGGKCVGAFPGSAYICAKENLLERVRPEQGRTVYLNLGKHYREAKSRSQTPNTPNVTLFWALDQAIGNILDEGIDARIARYKKCAAMLREGLRSLGLELLLHDEENMSNTVTSAFLPSGTDLKSFILCLESKGYTVYEGKGKYQEQGMFQVANMGDLCERDCAEFISALDGVLKEIAG